MNSIAALLSGGVDSAVALTHFIERHPELRTRITAYYLKIWLEDELSFLGNCPWEEDLYFAKAVTQQLGVPLEVIPLQHEYYEQVVSYTIEEIKRGGTPSPDIFCNQKIKFGAFLEKVKDVDRVISGHYAQIVREEKVQLYRSLDKVKDQTYFLSHLSYDQLSILEFPLGNISKHEVRQYAKEKKLAPYQRKDSQGICFLGKIKYSDFIKYHLGTKSGPIVNIQNGDILGRHEGSWFYTIGQRSGLRLGRGPWYVIKKSFEDNVVWVHHGTDLQASGVSVVPISHIHWLHADAYEDTIRMDDLQVKLRHGPHTITARLEYDSAQSQGKVFLSQSDTGVAEGQFVVFYREDECLGCARIGSV